MITKNNLLFVIVGILISIAIYGVLNIWYLSILIPAVIAIMKLFICGEYLNKNKTDYINMMFLILGSIIGSMIFQYAIL